MHPIATLLLVGALGVLAGCPVRPPTPFKDSPGSGPVTNPFVPASLIIHPLTRVDTDAGGKRWLYCHIEFRDSWGDTIKATGTLELQLYRPGATRGESTQELVWSVDLSDLEVNASLYDPATRTYRLPLEGPPAWLSQPTPEGFRAKLKAFFITGGPREGTRTLESEFTL